jgi:hypothetical protein
MGPSTPEERDFFWAEVKRHQCVLLQFLNDAIIGLVYIQGVPSIAYDEQEARRIWRAKWQGADRTLTPALEAQHAQKVQKWLGLPMGSTTPWFRSYSS